MTLIKDLISIPERVHQGDFVLKLADGVAHGLPPAKAFRDSLARPMNRFEHRQVALGARDNRRCVRVNTSRKLREQIGKSAAAPSRKRRDANTLDAERRKDACDVVLDVVRQQVPYVTVDLPHVCRGRPRRLALSSMAGGLRAYSGRKFRMGAGNPSSSPRRGGVRGR